MAISSRAGEVRQIEVGQSYRIQGFDGLRAMAVILVWLQHRTSSFSGSGVGDMGVGLFFTISGFLIVNIIWRQRVKIEQVHSTLALEWKSFVVRRAFRIFPVYILFLLIILPCAAFVGDQGIDAKAIMFHVLYMVNFWVNNDLQDWNATTTHLWSLAVEEQFYILFPILALVAPSGRLAAICIIVALLGYIYGIVSVTYLRPFAPLIASPVGFGQIAIGGALVLLYARGRPQSGSSILWSALPLALYISLPFLIKFFIGHYSALGLSLLPATILVGIALTSIYYNQNSLLVNFLEFSFIRNFGIISYGFYVYHYPLNIEFIDKLCKLHLQTAMPSLVKHAADFIMPLVAATLSWHLLEKRILARRSSSAGGPHELPSAADVNTRSV